MPHQVEILDITKDFKNVAYGLGMGLGKTFIGSEKLMDYRKSINLVIVQKSKINDWVEHFKKYYSEFPYFTEAYDLTKKEQYEKFLKRCKDVTEPNEIYDEWTEQYYKFDSTDPTQLVGVINYDVVWRRSELKQLTDFVLMLDESSMIQHYESKRTKFIMSLRPSNVILLSGTFTNGKLENLYTQAYLTGYKISKLLFEQTYTIKRKREIRTPQGIKRFNEIVGYKNQDILFKKLNELGWIFRKTSDVITLPDTNTFILKDKCSNDLKKYRKHKYIVIDDKELIGDTATNRFLHQRQLCGIYSKEKQQRVEDIINSTDERIIIFYNFIDELKLLEKICKKCDRPISYMNGSKKDLSNYESCDNSITLIQYQSGAYGLNLQKCNQTIYFTPPLSCEMFEQSKARTNRLGQTRKCFYYQLVIEGSIEEHIYQVLEQRQDFTLKLFEQKETMYGW